MSNAGWLSNTSEQIAGAIGRGVARYLLGLPHLPSPLARPTSGSVEDVPVSENDIKRIAGTYIVKRSGGPGSVGSRPETQQLYKRTMRIYYDNGKMVLQRFGQLPVPILKQSDGTFRYRGAQEPVISFTTDGNITTIFSKSPSGVSDSGPMAGKADVKTFRNLAFGNLK